MIEPQLLSVDERAALRQCCLRYFQHAPRDNWNIQVTEATRPAFEGIRDAGYIDLHGDVAALRPNGINACAYILALNE
jgi:hypothetical protein